jgi:hypothetical protein
VVVISHPYPPDAFAINLLFSTSDPADRTDDLLRASEETRRELRSGEMLVSIVQAINRVRCRRVVDTNGGCEPTDIFMLMDREQSQWSTEIVDTLRKEMKGVHLERWNISINGREKTGVRNSSYGDRLVRHLQDLPDGEYLLALVMDTLEVPERGRKTIRSDLNKPTSVLCQAVRNIGWSYEVRRVGQRNQAYLVKGQNSGGQDSYNTVKEDA